MWVGRCVWSRIVRCCWFRSAEARLVGLGRLRNEQISTNVWVNRELCNWNDFGLSVGDDKKLFFRKGDNMECSVSSSKLLKDMQNGRLILLI